MSDVEVVICSCEQCGQMNRVIVDRLESAKCGKCGSGLSCEAGDALDAMADDAFDDDDIDHEDSEVTN